MGGVVIWTFLGCSGVRGSHQYQQHVKFFPSAVYLITYRDLSFRRIHSAREIQETFSENERPVYTTVQTTVYRMENKKVVHRFKKIGNAHIFDASISRNTSYGKLIDNLLGLLGGSAQPVMSHLIETEKLIMEDLEEAKETLRKPSSANP